MHLGPLCRRTSLRTNFDIVIPTYNRAGALAVTLTSLAYLKLLPERIIISDQTEAFDVADNKEVQAAVRVLELKGVQVSLKKHLPRRGMAEQREFLLAQSTAPAVLFLDDDLILEPYVTEIMLRCLNEQRCGFVGSAVIGLSYIKDVRPHEQDVELWTTEVTPEVVVPRSKEWQRYKLHNAANLLHVQKELIEEGGETYLPYKVAWVGGCVLYDAEKLRQCGGYSFWKDLPENHCGEDVLAQLRVMARFGGCGVMPSGVYHQELPTTVVDRTVNAPERIELTTQDL